MSGASPAVKPKTLEQHIAYWVFGLLGSAFTGMMMWVAVTTSQTASDVRVTNNTVQTMLSTQKDFKVEMRTITNTFTTKEQVEQALELVKKDLSIQASEVSRLSKTVESLEERMEDYH